WAVLCSDEAERRISVRANSHPVEHVGEAIERVIRELEISTGRVIHAGEISGGIVAVEICSFGWSPSAGHAIVCIVSELKHHGSRGIQFVCDPSELVKNECS